MLQPARKLWRRRGGGTRAHRQRWLGGSAGDAASCSLGALEEAILGVQRFDDVPGFEIPGRYFNYLRTGDLEPLQAVFEHNRLDLLSLAALTAMAAQMADEGPGGAPSPHEALAMGQIYERLGRRGGSGRVLLARVRDGRCRVGRGCHRPDHPGRRAAPSGAAPAAAAPLRGCGGGMARAARERRRRRAISRRPAGRSPSTTSTARTTSKAPARFAEHALASERDPAEADALRHRLARLDRKLGRP